MSNKQLAVVISMPELNSEISIENFESLFEDLKLKIVYINGDKNDQRKKAMCASDIGAI